MGNLYESINAYNVIALVFVAVTTGGIYWFTRSFWPWFTALKDLEAANRHQRELKRIEAENLQVERIHIMAEGFLEATAETNRQLGKLEIRFQQFTTMLELLVRESIDVEQKDTDCRR